MTKSQYPFPRVRDLPECERMLFGNWIAYQRRMGQADHPLVHGIEMPDQDFFWVNDYKIWSSFMKDELYYD